MAETGSPNVKKVFPAGLLRVSIAWSISKTKYSYKKMMSILKSYSKAEIIEQMKIAYEYFMLENKDTDFHFPTLILVGKNDITGKVKTYCRAWAKQTGSELHWIKNARHFSNGDNPEQVNKEIELFININENKHLKYQAIPSCHQSLCQCKGSQHHIP